MRFLSAVLLVLMLGSSAYAMPENATVGPYSISFDMNTSMNYSIESLSPVDEEKRTRYPLSITGEGSQGATITIFEYKEITDSSQYLWQTINRQSLERLGLKNIILASDMVIDDMPAYGLAAQDASNKTLYTAYYWLDSTDCECGPVSVGRTNVVVVSSFPLEVTGNLLDSLHVEKGAAPAGPMTFAPK